MNPPKPSKPTPIYAWQIEREKLLQRSFVGMDRRTPPSKLNRTLRRISKRFRGQPFKCDPSRRWQLSVKTLQRLFRQWCAGGKIREALRLHYRAGRRLTDDLFRQFAAHCISHTDCISVATAFRSFTAENLQPFQQCTWHRRVARADAAPLRALFRARRDAMASIHQAALKAARSVA